MANIELTQMELVHTSIALGIHIEKYVNSDYGPGPFESEINTLMAARAKVISVLKAEYPIDQSSVPNNFWF